MLSFEIKPSHPTQELVTAELEPVLLCWCSRLCPRRSEGRQPPLGSPVSAFRGEGAWTWPCLARPASLRSAEERLLDLFLFLDADLLWPSGCPASARVWLLAGVTAEVSGPRRCQAKALPVCPVSEAGLQHLLPLPASETTVPLTQRGLSLPNPSAPCCHHYAGPARALLQTAPMGHFPSLRIHAEPLPSLTGKKRRRKAASSWPWRRA